MTRLFLCFLCLPLTCVLTVTIATSSTSRGVSVEGKAPAQFVAQEYGKSFAVVIGIDEYQTAPRLSYAVADAKAVATVLQQQGFQVTLLLNQQATRRALYKELFDKLGHDLGDHDRVLIFFAGHGETRQLKAARKMGYLLPVDGNSKSLGETSLSMSAIRDLADSLPAKHMLFLIDACYGGIAGHQFRSIPKVTEQYLREVTKERGRQIITAGDENQQALEGPQWGHSVFTYYVLQGLEKGLADLNGDGIIPASELYQYLDSRVFAAATMEGHRQRPQWWSLAAEKGEFVFYTALYNTRRFPLTTPDQKPKKKFQEKHHTEKEVDPDNIKEARLRPYTVPEQRTQPFRLLDGTYKFQAVGKQGSLRIPDPNPSPYFEPYIWVTTNELTEKHLRFHKDGRFEELTYTAMQYMDPGTTSNDPTKQTPQQLKETNGGHYQLRGTKGLLTYLTGRKVRFYLPPIDEAFWPPETIMIQDNRWELIE